MSEIENGQSGHVYGSSCLLSQLPLHTHAVPAYTHIPFNHLTQTQTQNYLRTQVCMCFFCADAGHYVPNLAWEIVKVRCFTFVYQIVGPASPMPAALLPAALYLHKGTLSADKCNCLHHACFAIICDARHMSWQ